MEFIGIISELNNLLGDPAEIGSYVDTFIKTMAFLTLMIALVQCFFGYKLFKIQLAIAGFLVFGAIGAAIGFATSFDSDKALIYGLLSGLLGGFLSLTLYRIGVFIFLGFIGFLIGFILTQSSEVAVILALILGIAGIFILKPLVIISTSVSGGLLAGSSLAAIVGGKDSGTGIFFGLLFIVLGLFIQFKIKVNKSGSISTKAHEEEFVIFNSGNDETTGNAPTSNTVNNVVDEQVTPTMVKTEQDKKKMDEMNATEKTFKKVTESIISHDKYNEIKKVLANMENVLNGNNISKNIMPFAEYILGFLVFLSVFASFTSMLLIMVFGALTLIKKKYELFLVSFGLILFSKTIYFLKAFQSLSFSFISLLELAVLGLIVVMVGRVYLKNVEGINTQEKVLNILKSISANMKQVSKDGNLKEEVIGKLVCKSCGDFDMGDVSYCKNCGTKFTREDPISLE